jgi:Transposase DDE domain
MIGSVIGLLGLDLAVPDHSTLSRRAKTLEVPPLRRLGTGPLHLLVDSTGLKLGGVGELPIEKHGTSRRRSWRKLAYRRRCQQRRDRRRRGDQEVCRRRSDG